MLCIAQKAESEGRAKGLFNPQTRFSIQLLYNPVNTNLQSRDLEESGVSIKMYQEVS